MIVSEPLYPLFPSPIAMSFTVKNLGRDLPLPTPTAPNYVIKVYASTSEGMGSGVRTDISPRALDNLPTAYYRPMKSGAEYTLDNLQVSGGIRCLDISP